MLFSTLNESTLYAIQSCENLIADLERQLTAARENLSQLNQQKQAELAAQSAAQSALEMCWKARKMVAAIYGHKGVEEFNTAFMEQPLEVAILNSQEESEQEAPSITVDEDSNATEESDPQTIDVEAKVSQENTPAPDVEVQHNGNGHKPQPQFLTVNELKTLQPEILRAIATSKGVPTNGNRWHIAKRLDGKVFQSEIEQFSLPLLNNN